MVIHRYYPNKTETVETVGGSWAGNTPNMVACLCYQVYIKSASAGTTYNATVTDRDGVVVRKWTGATQIVNDLTPTPCEGIYTIAIDTASADEGFTVLVQFLEGQR